MSHDHGHHKETFITKYVFSQDHKMIAKQFLVTGMIMGVIGVMMSMLFRFQLAWPGESFPILEVFLGKWAPDGVMSPDIYLALVTIHGTIMVFFVLTAGLSGTFSNLLIPLQIGARDMASGFINMLSYWFFFLSSVLMVASLFVENGPAAAGWTIYPPLSASATGDAGFWDGYDAVAGFHGYLHCFVSSWFAELYRYRDQPENQRDVNDTSSADNLGVPCDGYSRCAFIPRSFIGSAFVDF